MVVIFIPLMIICFLFDSSFYWSVCCYDFAQIDSLYFWLCSDSQQPVILSRPRHQISLFCDPSNPNRCYISVIAHPIDHSWLPFHSWGFPFSRIFLMIAFAPSLSFNSFYQNISMFLSAITPTNWFSLASHTRFGSIFPPSSPLSHNPKSWHWFWKHSLGWLRKRWTKFSMMISQTNLTSWHWLSIIASTLY